MQLEKLIFNFTQYIRWLCLETLWLLSLQHVQQSLQATQAQQRVREPCLFYQLENPTEADANDLQGRKLVFIKDQGSGTEYYSKTI